MVRFVLATLRAAYPAYLSSVRATLDFGRF